MYYNKITGVWVLDVFDYILISTCVGSAIASFLRNYISEEMSMVRLKNDIIRKSKLLKPSPLLKPKRKVLNAKELKIQRIYNLARNIRGRQGAYEFADQIKDMVVKLAILLKRKEIRSRVLKTMFSNARLVLELILSISRINLQYIMINDLDPEIIIIASTVGGTTGFVCSWFFAGSLLTIPPIFSIFLLRNIYQQKMHNIAYLKLKSHIGKLLDDKNIRKHIGRLLTDKDVQDNINKLLKHKDIQKGIQAILIDNQNQINNASKIKLQNLNWNKNPEIKKTAEQLGIFKNPPHSTGKLSLDVRDPNSSKIIEEKFGILLNPDPIQRIKYDPIKSIKYDE